jgi:NitT/TauT family transport system permease protein
VKLIAEIDEIPVAGAGRQHQAVGRRRHPEGVDGARHGHGQAIGMTDAGRGQRHHFKAVRPDEPVGDRNRPGARVSRLTIVLARRSSGLRGRVEFHPRLSGITRACCALGDMLYAGPARGPTQEAMMVTAAEVVVAFVIAVPLGALIGVAVPRATISAKSSPCFYVFSVPKSIFLPMFILKGTAPKVAYACSTLFIVIMSATAAVESVKPEHVLVARSYGATRRQILLRVYVPSMVPILLETLRIAMIFNFTAVMIAEMYASRTGIGHMIANWGENFQMRQLFAGVILLAVVAILFNETIRWLETRCSTWRT